MQPISEIHIYDAPETIGLDIDQVAAYLTELLPSVTITPHTDYFTQQLARFTPEQIDQVSDQLVARLAEREISDADDSDIGTVYDAPRLQEVMRPLLPEDQRGPDHLHIVFLTHCIARQSTDEAEYRLRIQQQGVPLLISTTGFVEALELPREYIFRRAQLEALGAEDQIEELEDDLAARILTYVDPRVTEVAKGYALQAVLGHFLGEAGCESPDCRMFKARTHEELTRAQFSAGTGLCERHARLLDEFTEDAES